jgi:UDP-N-acetylglucosamine--N-acetylmuramyl-(pentapeptide) pyrophosphoryl-undecaprenol N-acetylglucosamine transferase
MEHALVPVPVHVISAGKLRRYHGVPLWRQLLDIPTVLKNIRDIARIAIGFFQSVALIRKFRPDVVFAKGGYVCLPLGYAAKMLGVPMVIHDSDTRPGLTNKLLSRFARLIATGSPLENYPYPAEKTTYTGVPIDPAFHPLSAEEQRHAKQKIGIVDLTKPLVVVTGGGLGAESINKGVGAVAEQLIDSGFALYHVTGKLHFENVKRDAYQHADYHIVDFVYKDMLSVLGAADIVVSRASATFLQELAALAKPAIIVPASHLSDQVKNAEVYREAKAAIVLSDKEVRSGEGLLSAIEHLASKKKETQEMASRFHKFARSDAAIDVAHLIVSAMEKKS